MLGLEELLYLELVRLQGTQYNIQKLLYCLEDSILELVRLQGRQYNIHLPQKKSN